MLKNAPVFQGLTDSQMQQIEKRCIRRNFPRNAMVIHEGDTEASLFVIEKGRVKVYLSGTDGREIIINTHGPGEQFGELALIDGERRSASIMTCEESSFLVINKQIFNDLVRDFPEISFNLIVDLSRKIRRLTKEAKTLAFADTYQRLRIVLQDLAEQGEGGENIPIALTQQEIADRIGASREVVSRMLHTLTQDGFLTRNKRRYTIVSNLPEAISLH